MTVQETIERAVAEFSELFGQPVHSVTGVEPAEDGGWTVLVDVVELERIPRSTSLLATYGVEVDERGRLISYKRLRRFSSGM